MTLRPSRYTTFALCILVLLVATPFAAGRPWVAVVAGVALVLVLVGIRDLFQPHHSILRNYPVLGHIRWLAETVRPEIRQYLIEGEDDAAPFSRAQRSLVYARAKNEGKTLGRPSALTQEQRSKALGMLSEGVSVAQIADALGTSRQTIMRVRDAASTAAEVA